MNSKITLIIICSFFGLACNNDVPSIVISDKEGVNSKLSITLENDTLVPVIDFDPTPLSIQFYCWCFNPRFIGDSVRICQHQV